MTGRHSVGLADLDLLARRILEGTLENRPGCVLEISNLAWSQNSLEAQHRFEDACEGHGIVFRVVQQLTAVDWVCPP
ncbi:MAG: hypothetical protein ACREOF_08805 [Gemmatimonadales bacterium]